MAKKKKRSSESSKPKALISPLQLALIALVIAAYLLYKDPSLLHSLPIHLPQIATSSSQIATPSASITDSIKGLYSKAQDYFINFATNTNIPTKFTGLPEEIVIDEVVSSFTAEVKDLPKTQVKRIKAQICQDVINEATATISATP